MIVTTKQLFQHAYGKYAIGAYNINNLEQTVGLFRGNLGKSKSNDDPVNPAKSAPFILQISRGARGYSDKRFLESMIRTADEVLPEVIFAVHLDHGTEEVCYDCIDSGFYSSVMIDASHEPFEKNIETTRRVADRAHAKGIVVEAELGQLGGVEEDVHGSVCLTDPSQAAEFIEKSHCDSLAVAIGTSHGAFKFTGKQGLHLDVLEEIQKAVPPRFPLVMHGSSSVPKEWVDRINNAGGKMKSTSGVPEDQYLPGAKLGVCKVNIDTDGRLVWCAIHREAFRDDPANFDLRPPGKVFIQAYADYIVHKNTMLGSAGQLEGVRATLAKRLDAPDVRYHTQRPAIAQRGNKMQYRTFGRTGWQVSEIGYGMWGMGGWSGSDDAESLDSLRLAVELGCDFFDTALAYGDGHSERLLGQLVRQYPDKKLCVATKIPPKNGQWPSRRDSRLKDVFPPDYIREMTEKSLENLGLDHVDLQQFHVWEDAWAQDECWQRAVDDLKRQGIVRAVGLSINRWEPWNALKTLRTGMIDAVQVIYNIFDQAPEDKLFPLCQELNIGVIARVPFDEGTLTGKLTKESRWPAGDWRNSYFVRENLAASVNRADRLKPLVPEGMTMAQLALAFILANPAVGTIIPGMRKKVNVRDNIAAGDQSLPIGLLQELKSHRWDRTPTDWSQ